MNCSTCFGWVIVLINIGRASEIEAALFCYVCEGIKVCIMKTYKVNDNSTFPPNVQFHLLPSLRLCQFYSTVVVYSLCFMQFGTTDPLHHTCRFTLSDSFVSSPQIYDGHIPSVYLQESMCTSILIEECSIAAHVLIGH